MTDAVERRLRRNVRISSAIGLLLGIPLAWLATQAIGGLLQIGRTSVAPMAGFAICAGLGLTAVAAAWWGSPLLAARSATVLVVLWFLVGSPFIIAFGLGLVLMLPGLPWLPLALTAYRLQEARDPADAARVQRRLVVRAVAAAVLAVPVGALLVLAVLREDDRTSAFVLWLIAGALAGVLATAGQVMLLVPVLGRRWAPVVPSALVLMTAWLVSAAVLTVFGLAAIALLALLGLLIARDARSLALVDAMPAPTELVAGSAS